MARFRHQTKETSTIRTIRPKANKLLIIGIINIVLNSLILSALIWHILISKLGL